MLVCAEDEDGNPTGHRWGDLAAMTTGELRSFVDQLAGFDEAQLRQFVLAGQRMAEKRHENPTDNALRWVQENRLAG